MNEYSSLPPLTKHAARRVWIYFSTLRADTPLKAIHFIESAKAWVGEFGDGKLESVKFDDIPKGLRYSDVAGQ